MNEIRIHYSHMAEIRAEAFRCDRCRYMWLPGTSERPLRCPNPQCMSQYWNLSSASPDHIEKETRKILDVVLSELIANAVDESDERASVSLILKNGFCLVRTEAIIDKAQSLAGVLFRKGKVVRYLKNLGWKGGSQRIANNMYWCWSKRSIDNHRKSPAKSPKAKQFAREGLGWTPGKINTDRRPFLGGHPSGSPAIEPRLPQRRYPEAVIEMDAPSWDEIVTKLAAARGGLESLAVELGVSYFTVYRWSRGINIPSRMGQDKLRQLRNSK